MNENNDFKCGHSLEEYKKIIGSYIELNNFIKAEELIQYALTDYPDKAILWLLYVRIATDNYTKLYDKTHIGYLEQAKLLANSEELILINNEYEPFKKKIENAICQEHQNQKSVAKKRDIFFAVCILIGFIIAYAIILSR